MLVWAIQLLVSESSSERLPKTQSFYLSSLSIDFSSSVSQSFTKELNILECLINAV